MKNAAYGFVAGIVTSILMNPFTLPTSKIQSIVMLMLVIAGLVWVAKSRKSIR